MRLIYIYIATYCDTNILRGAGQGENLRVFRFRLQADIEINIGRVPQVDILNIREKLVVAVVGYEINLATFNVEGFDYEQNIFRK